VRCTGEIEQLVWFRWRLYRHEVSRRKARAELLLKRGELNHEAADGAGGQGGDALRVGHQLRQSRDRRDPAARIVETLDHADVSALVGAGSDSSSARNSSQAGQEASRRSSQGCAGSGRASCWRAARAAGMAAMLQRRPSSLIGLLR
jgi:hypothetical protein